MPYADPIAGRTYNREYKRANRFRYRSRQKLYDAAKHANARAVAYGVPGTITPEEVAAVLAVGRCRYCGAAPEELTLDHIVPMDNGGPNTIANLGAACNACNVSKFRGTRPLNVRSATPERWARDHDACIDCSETSRIHSSHGRCDRCHQRFVKARRHFAEREGLPAAGN